MAFAEGAARAHMSGLLGWLQDEAFALSVAEWSWDWCVEFPKTIPRSDFEHPLHFTDVHKQYRELFDARAGEYLAQHGLQVDNFLRLAVEFLATDCSSLAHDIFEGLVASESYPAFFEYMSAVRRRREWAEETVCCSSDAIDWAQLVKRSVRRDLGDVVDDSDVESLE